MFSFQGQVLVFIIISHIVFVELMPSLGLCNKADDSTKGMYDVPTYARIKMVEETSSSDNKEVGSAVVRGLPSDDG